uniref:Uncharacterized protein n=1 Tax=Anguilla anguilla TaxID=7936 RepID=A0A0E9RIT0_ANGAN
MILKKECICKYKFLILWCCIFCTVESNALLFWLLLQFPTSSTLYYKPRANGNLDPSS